MARPSRRPSVEPPTHHELRWARGAPTLDDLAELFFTEPARLRAVWLAVHGELDSLEELVDASGVARGAFVGVPDWARDREGQP